jgi:hypothetical protein
MTEYLVIYCKRDGTTPLGQCPKVMLEIDDQTPGRMNSYQRVLCEFYKQFPDCDVVSWGTKEQIARLQASE